MKLPIWLPMMLHAFGHLHACVNPLIYGYQAIKMFTLRKVLQQTAIRKRHLNQVLRKFTYFTQYQFSSNSLYNRLLYLLLKPRQNTAKTNYTTEEARSSRTSRFRHLLIIAAQFLGLLASSFVLPIYRILNRKFSEIGMPKIVCIVFFCK